MNFWTEEEFVNEAIKAKHPLSLESAVPQQLLEAIEFNAVSDDVDVARLRANFSLGPKGPFNRNLMRKL